jgi:hypothetical protein
MEEFDFPTQEEVLGFGSGHNPAVWSKHKAHLANSSDLLAVLEKCRSNSGKLSRRHVFEMADAKPEWGVIGAIVWGFPRGSMPGGKWLAFAKAIELSTQFADTLAGFKDASPSAIKAVVQLNSLVAGLGFATTTKMAYFARLNLQEGPALIYDANVIKAITDPSKGWDRVFPKTRLILGPTGSHAKGVLSYSSYIEEAAALAVKHNTTPEIVEVALFRSVARAGTWS